MRIASIGLDANPSRIVGIARLKNPAHLVDADALRGVGYIEAVAISNDPARVERIAPIVGGLTEIRPAGGLHRIDDAKDGEVDIAEVRNIDHRHATRLPSPLAAMLDDCRQAARLAKWAASLGEAERARIEERRDQAGL